MVAVDLRQAARRHTEPPDRITPARPPATSAAREPMLEAVRSSSTIASKLARRWKSWRLAFHCLASAADVFSGRSAPLPKLAP